MKMLLLGGATAAAVALCLLTLAPPCCQAQDASSPKLLRHDVKFWEKWSPPVGNSSEPCDEPSDQFDFLFANCTTNGSFPALSARCQCAECDLTTDFRCDTDEGVWQSADFFVCTHDLCVTCPAHVPKNLLCEGGEFAAGKVGDARTCTCRHTCLDVPVECLSRGTSEGHWQYECNKVFFSRKTDQLQHWERVFDEGQYHFSCLPGFQLHGNTNVTCNDGVLSEPFPSCVPQEST